MADVLSPSRQAGVYETFADQGDGSHALRVGIAVPGTVVTVALTTPTGALSDGDVMAATQIVAGAVRIPGGRALLESVVAIDTDDQGVAFDLVFLSANTSLGAEDSAPDIDDTEVLDVIGIVSVAGGDYVDLGGSRVATVKGIGLYLQAATGSTSIYVAAITRGTPTYASGVVRVALGFLQD